MSDVVTGPDGEPVGLVTVCEDVSERRRAEEAEAASRERYRRFFTDDLAGAAIMDAGGRIRDWNPAFEQMCGLAPGGELEQALGGLLRDPEDAAGLLERVARETRLQVYDLPMRRRDGAPMLAMASFAGIFDDAGRLVEINSYCVDVTEHRLLEEQLGRRKPRTQSHGSTASLGKP